MRVVTFNANGLRSAVRKGFFSWFARQRADVLFVASLLTVAGVAFNRMNVVIFAMTLRGRMPWGAPESYVPSIVEWGVSIGLIAATIFLFGLGARLMPVLPKEQPSHGH